MGDIPRQSIAAILVFSLVFVLVGLFFTITRYHAHISGASVISDEINVQVELLQESVDFGKGYVDPLSEKSSCRLSSSEPKPDCWIAIGEYNPKNFRMKNEGNVPLNVTIQSTSSEYAFRNFINLSDNKTEGSYYWKARREESEPVICDELQRLDGAAEYIFTGYQQQVCHMFSPEDGNDEIIIGITLDVPVNSKGYFEKSVVFTTKP